MNGWQLVTLLAALFNTGAIVYWQRANETRMDLQWERLRDLQKQTKELLPMLNQVSRQVQEWEHWRDTEWRRQT